MRIVAELALHEGADPIDLGLRDPLRPASRTDQIDHAKGLEDDETIRIAKLREAVAREERRVNPLHTVPPPAQAVVEREEDFHAGTAAELVAHALLVARTGPHRVPARIREYFAHFSRSAVNVVPVRVVTKRMM